MKKILVVMFLFLLTLGIALNSPIVLAQRDKMENPGITPDSPLWGLDKALEQIQLILTTSPNEKAKFGLEIAKERLMEIKAMIQENKLEDAEKAKEEHGKALGKVKKNVEEIEEEDAEEEIRGIIEIEKQLEKHNEDVEQTFGELKIKIKVDGELTSEQQVLIDSILESLQGQTGEVEIEIKNKKGKTKIKIKVETGKSDEEVEDEVEKIEKSVGMNGLKIKAKILDGKTEIKLKKKFSTTIIDREAIIEEIIKEFALERDTADSLLKIDDEEDEELEEKFKVKVKVKKGVAKVKVELKFILDVTDREAILNAIVEKSQLTSDEIKDVMKFRDKDKEKKDELEIEVEIENGEAKVEVELNGEEFEFTLETTDREVIISEIMGRTGLTKEEIEAVIKFETEDGDDGTGNSVPVITSDPVILVDEDTLYNYQVTATDADTNDVLIYSLTQNPDWLSIDSSAGLVEGTAPLVNADTNYAISIEVSDGTDSAVQTYDLTVTNLAA